MSNTLVNENDSPNSKSETIYSKCETNETFVPLKQLENMCQNWLTFINSDLIKSLDSKFNELIKSCEQNIEMKSQIQTKHESVLKDIISKDDINYKTMNYSNESQLMMDYNSLKSDVNSLKSELNDKKELKIEFSNKTKNITKSIEELKKKQIQLTKENSENNNSNECKTLATVMRIMYKTWNNSKVVGLLFNDSENLERLIIVDKQNKTEEQIAQQFWDELNEGYRITHNI